MKNTIGERLEAVKKHFHLSNRKLGQIAGISGQGIADIIKGVSKNPRNGIFVKVSDQLDVNLNWLLTGNGGMLRRSQAAEAPAENDGYVRLPLRTLGVNTASLLASSGRSAKGEHYPVLSKLAKLYTEPEVMRVRGDNMEPTLRHDDVVLVTPVAEADWAMMSSGLYVAAYPPDHMTVGRIIENTIEENGKLVLHADNPRFGKTTVATENIQKMWQVRRLLDREV